MVVLLVLSILYYHCFNKERDNLENTTSKFNKLFLSTNQLTNTVFEMERLMSLYIKDKNVDAYEEYLGEYYKFEHNSFLTDALLYHYPFYDDAKVIHEMIKKLRDTHAEGTIGTHEPIVVKLDNFITRITQHQLELEQHLNRQVKYLQELFIITTTATICYGLYFILRLYFIVVKPVIDNQSILKAINEGQEDLRLIYKYNNDISELFHGLNKYIDISQNSIKLIEDQYNRLRIYSDFGEINFVEYDATEEIIKITFCAKLVKRCNYDSSNKTFTLHEFAKMIHPDDLPVFQETVEAIKAREDREYRVDLRLKYPNCEDYMYISTIGQIYHDNDLTFMGVQLDITYLKEIQMKLAEQEEMYRLIIENTSDLIGKISPEGKLLFASKAYIETFRGVRTYIDEYDHLVKVMNKDWFKNIFKPPYSTREEILVETTYGDRWISWHNDAVMNENNEVEYIITVGHDITEIKRMYDKLKYDSEHDYLTDLLNRRGLYGKLDEFSSYNSLATFFIDLNNFKNINDLYGHEIGDKIITLIAQDLASFPHSNLIISRLSGDEFVVLVPNYNENGLLDKVKEYLNKHMNITYQIDGIDIFISTSIGYALYPDDTLDIETLISYADIAMYECKVSHLNECLRFNPRMYETVNKRVKIANDLKQAIDKDEFIIYFQEIVNVITNKVEYIEALVRWESDKGLLLPKDFIQVAEETGFMLVLDNLVIDKALKQFVEIRKNPKYADTILSINVSRLNLLNSNFPPNLYQHVLKHSIRPQDICIEINENTFMNNIEYSSYQIARLREWGFKIAIDDFGREYSSLSILNKVTFDIIKIDRLFVDNLDSQLSVEIINMVNRIAEVYQHDVIIEGVETREKVEQLKHLGCYLMQGYYFSEPKKLID